MPGLQHPEREMDWNVQVEVLEDIRRVNEIFATGVFTPIQDIEDDLGDDNIQELFRLHPLFRSALIEVLIGLRDLMWKATTYATRINFTEDVIITDQVRDVTDLVKYMRDALCHPDSNNHRIATSLISGNIIVGKGRLLTVGEVSLESNYEDDICLLIGKQRIYLARHIKRAFLQSVTTLQPLLPPAFGKSLIRDAILSVSR